MNRIKLVWWSVTTGVITGGWKSQGNGNGVHEEQKKEETHNLSRSLHQMELDVGEQVEVFTEFVGIGVKGECHLLLSWLRNETPVMLMCPDVTGVGQRAPCWQRWVTVRPGRVVMAHLLSVWFLRGMENRSYHINPQTGVKSRRWGNKTFLVGITVAGDREKGMVMLLSGDELKKAKYIKRLLIWRLAAWDWVPCQRVWSSAGATL